MDDVRETNMKIITNKFAEHYSSVGSKFAKIIQKSMTDLDVKPQFGETKIDGNFFFHPVVESEITKLVKNLNPKCSYGVDGISNKLFVHCYTALKLPLLLIFNESFSSCLYPKLWKISKVKPLYKGKEMNQIINYRPVSLLPVISKILEQLTELRLRAFLKRHGALYEGEYGFRKGCSCDDAILDLTGNIIESLDNKQLTLAVFLDMSKAFDTIEHKLLFKILDRYGIRGSALQWFESYFQDR